MVDKTETSFVYGFADRCACSTVRVFNKYVMELMSKIKKTESVCNNKTIMEIVLDKSCQIKVLRQLVHN